MNSLNIFTRYNFDKNKEIIKVVRGKKLLILILFTLPPLSLLLVNYFYINFELIFGLIFNKAFLNQFNYIYQIYLIIGLCILLIFRKTRIIIKKLALYNYFFIALIIWYTRTNNILISDDYLLNKFSNIDNYNFVNIMYLFTIELFYFLWSLLSNNNNLSDWATPVPKKIDILSISKIAMFYLFIAAYYSILEK